MIFELPVLDPILQFTVLVTAALLVQLTVERLHLPGLIGLLLIGMLIGPGGLEVVPREPVVELLGSVGLIYIMFLAGLEIDLGIVRSHKRETVGFGLLAFGCSLLPAFGVGLLLGLSPQAALLLGALLSSHTLVAYPVIERFRMLHCQSVTTAIGGTLVTDTLALVLLAIAIQRPGIGGDGGELSGLLPLAWLIVMAAASLLTIPRYSRIFFNHPRITSAEKALLALVILMVLSSGAELIGSEKIIGAFLAGICLNNPLAGQKDLREHIEFVGRMLFIPFFFVSTGMLLELDVFTERFSVWALAAIMLALVVAGKMSASWMIGARYGYSNLDRSLMTALTIPQAAATLAITMTAYQAGLFGDEFVDAVILLIFFTCLLGPLATRLIAKKLTCPPQT